MHQKRKQNQLLKGEEVAYLKEGSFYEFQNGAIPKKRFYRWTAVYLATAMLAILSVLLLLLSGSVTQHSMATGSFWGRSAQGLGSLFLGQDFMDLSGGKPDEQTNSDQKDNEERLDGFLLPDRDGNKNEENRGDSNSSTRPSLNKETLYAFDYDAVPKGHTAIVPVNLALSSYGSTYIHNSTGYHPDTAALLSGKWNPSMDFEYLSASGSPMVLIVHTHATEGYSKDGATSYEPSEAEYARSTDAEKNMIAVGKALEKALNDVGISTVHCTVLHDEVQYKDSYRRAEESIRQYLEKYPTIRLVIDLHRDAVVKSNGDLGRAVTLHNGEAVSQLMCVVGSDWNGQACPNWERNLSLALKLRESLNARCEDICRPTYLKSSTYNQELAPYSLLIEVGTSGNSLEESKRSMSLLALSLRDLIKEM